MGRWWGPSWSPGWTEASGNSWCDSEWYQLRVVRSSSPVATVLVQHGTLRLGNVLVAGTVWGKVRRILGEGRVTVRTAPPSTPVLTVGWKEVPVAGDKCVQVWDGLSGGSSPLTGCPLRLGVSRRPGGS